MQPAPVNFLPSQTVEGISNPSYDTSAQMVSKRAPEKLPSTEENVYDYIVDSDLTSAKGSMVTGNAETVEVAKPQIHKNIDSPSSDDKRYDNQNAIVSSHSDKRIPTSTEISAATSDSTYIDLSSAISEN